MIFRRKKQSEAPDSTPIMRGRTSVDKDANPLARRFNPNDEPDTIDLAEPAGFPSEPGTAELTAEKSDPQDLSVIALDPETGKLYARPGKGSQVVQLEGEPVLASTELRPGDRVRIGPLEMQISRVSRKE